MESRSQPDPEGGRVSSPVSGGTGVAAEPLRPLPVAAPGEGVAAGRSRLFGSAFSLLTAASLLVLVLYPLLAILIQSFLPDLFSVPARFDLSLSPLSRAFGDHETYTAMLNTLWLGGFVAIGGTLVGSVLAVFLTRTELPGRKLFDGLVWIPFSRQAIWWRWPGQLLFSRGGLIDSSVVPLPDAFVNTVFSPVGLTVLLILRLFPFSYLAVRAALSGSGLGSTRRRAAW